MPEYHVAYRCIVGSQAYGLATPESDEDVRGFYVAPPMMFWGLNKPPEQLENTEGDDTVFWEMGKFVNLSLKANPNVLECLWSPKVVTEGFQAKMLRKHRDLFLSKRIYQTYRGYAISQIKRIERYHRTVGEVRWKHPMHCLRLLISCSHTMREGEVLVDVGEYRDYLLKIRRGEVTMDEIRAKYDEWSARIDEEVKKTSLPDKPDTDAVSNLLVELRRQEFLNGKEL